ncbi:MAG: acyclic terpene utilization AtuA family protein [Hyphomicrobiaceae bacterium]
MKLYAPTGALGMGFLDSSLERAIAWKPDVIACDAGSTDSGPSHLGGAIPKMSRAAIVRDLERLLQARQALNVPLIIGSCGTSGVDSGVDWTADIAIDIAKRHSMKFRLARIYAEQNGQALAEKWTSVQIEALPGAPQIAAETFTDCSHIVAMMGAEPIQKALAEGAEVILAGRASDTALFAALPLMRGLPPGPIWHCAKTIECGAVCSTISRADGMLAEIDANGFDIEPAALDAAATPLGIASHTLYENADPHLIREPSGTLDTTDSRYEQRDARTTRVTGSAFRHEAYTVKLEGAAPVGYQTVVIGGVRDPVIIGQLDTWLAEMEAFFASRAKELTGLTVGEELRIDITVYGRDGVMGADEPAPTAMHEVGLLFTVTAPTQAQANDVARFAAHVASHWPVPEWDGFISGIAFPYSPPEIDRGMAWRFALHHVVHTQDPCELFRFRFDDIGRKS